VSRQLTNGGFSSITRVKGTRVCEYIYAYRYVMGLFHLWQGLIFLVKHVLKHCIVKNQSINYTKQQYVYIHIQ